MYVATAIKEKNPISERELRQIRHALYDKNQIFFRIWHHLQGHMVPADENQVFY